jgi:hypothetical protein
MSYYQRKVNLPSTPVEEAILRAVNFKFTSPGSVVHDFEVLLNLVHDKPQVLTPTLQLTLATVVEVNNKVKRPLVSKLKRLSNKSFPNVQGLYVLLRASGLSYVDEKSNKSLITVSDQDYQHWMSFNNADKYGNLLEAWLLRGFPEILGEHSNYYDIAPPTFRDVSDMIGKMNPEPIVNSTKKYETEYFRYSPGYPNMLLMELFGLADIGERLPNEGEGWTYDQIRATPFGAALIGILVNRLTPYKYFFGGFGFPSIFDSDKKVKELAQQTQQEEEAELFSPQYGLIYNALASYFTTWKTPIIPVIPDIVEGKRTFKVSLDKDIWRRISISSNYDLDRLAQLIIRAFAFDMDHLYEFLYTNRIGKEIRIQHPAMEYDFSTDELTVGQIAVKVGQRFSFHFDFGDDWYFDVVLESIDAKDTKNVAKVIEKVGKAPKQYPNW